MKVKILIVEDEVLVAEEIATDLEDYGFAITDIAISSDECLNAINKNTPHVVLMDINIQGDHDGIATANVINETYNIPIVFLTANTDSETIKRALLSSPSAFISKPYSKKDLVVALEIAFNNYNNKLLNQTVSQVNNDSFFVKSGDYYTKIDVSDINYLEADGSYTSIFTNNKKYTLASNLNHFQENFSNPIFVRVHRSYIVNIKKVEAFDKNSIILNSQAIPVSKSYQKEVMKLFNKI